MTFESNSTCKMSGQKSSELIAEVLKKGVNIKYLDEPIEEMEAFAH